MPLDEEAETWEHTEGGSIWSDESTDHRAWSHRNQEGGLDQNVRVLPMNRPYPHVGFGLWPPGLRIIFCCIKLPHLRVPSARSLVFSETLLEPQHTIPHTPDPHPSPAF